MGTKYSWSTNYRTNKSILWGKQGAEETQSCGRGEPSELRYQKLRYLTSRLGKHELWPTLVCCPPPKSFCWLILMRTCGCWGVTLSSGKRKGYTPLGICGPTLHSTVRALGREGECRWMHSEMPTPKNFKSSWGDRPAICTKRLMNHGKLCKIESECFVSWYLRTPDIQRSGK